MKSKKMNRENIYSIRIYFSWILKFFYSADKNRSNTLSKKECQDLLIDSFHVKIPHHIFEQMFNVKFCCCFF
jgi:plasmid maintenance system killer protein